MVRQRIIYVALKLRGECFAFNKGAVLAVEYQWGRVSSMSGEECRV
jgi:hypothetical protein